MEKETGNCLLQISIILKIKPKHMNSNQDQNNKETIDLENINSEEIKIDKKSTDIKDDYKFGWSGYSEITNGRFAMLGFLAIILIELLSQKSFLNWAGIF